MFCVAPVTRLTTSKSPSAILAPVDEAGTAAAADVAAGVAGTAVAGAAVAATAGIAVAAGSGAWIAVGSGSAVGVVVDSAVAASTGAVGPVVGATVVATAWTGAVVATGPVWAVAAVSGWRKTGGIASGGVVGIGPTATLEPSVFEHALSNNRTAATAAKTGCLNLTHHTVVAYLAC